MLDADTGERSLRLLVLDGQRAFAEALAGRIVDEPGIATAFAAADVDEATDLLDAQEVDVLVASYDGDEARVLALLRGVARGPTGLPVVAMSANADPAVVARAMLAGAIGWVPKQTGVAELAEVVHRAGRGEASYPPRVLGAALGALADGTPVPESGESLLAGLTYRERQILDAMIDGLSRRDIADRLGVSVNTVRTHVQHLLSKLGVHSVLEAVSMALREQPRRGAAVPPG